VYKRIKLKMEDTNSNHVLSTKKILADLCMDILSNVLSECICKVLVHKPGGMIM
jgi:hypothetical protein